MDETNFWKQVLVKKGACAQADVGDQQGVETNLERKGNKLRKTSRNGWYGWAVDRGQGL